MSKNEHDWVLIGLVLLLAVFIVLFAVGASGSFHSLDIVITTNGSPTITFTGISEIIISFALAVGIFIRARQK